MKNLSDRLETALSRAGETRQGLAKALGVTRQSLYPTGQMASDKVAKIARHLRCDMYWLATGEGGKYREADPVIGELVNTAEALSREDRIKLLEIAKFCARGMWPKL